MRRTFIFWDPEGKKELVLPVTPKGYEVQHGRRVTSLTMHQTGEVNLPGSAVLLDQELEVLLPAREYPFNEPGASLNPFTYIEQFEKWSDAGTVLRFTISGTPVNAAVLLGPVRFREQDGTGDVYCTLPLKGYRALKTAERAGSRTETKPRTAAQAAAATPSAQAAAATSAVYDEEKGTFRVNLKREKAQAIVKEKKTRMGAKKLRG